MKHFLSNQNENDADFKRQYIDKNLWFQRFSIIIAVIAYIGFGYFHSVKNPYISNYVLEIRLGIITPMALCLFVLTFFKSYEKFGSFLFALTILLAGVSMIFLIKMSHAPVKYYLISSLVILLFINYGLKIMVPWVLFSGWGTILAYNLIEIFSPMLDSAYFSMSSTAEILYMNLYLIIVNLYGSYVSFAIEFSEKKEFLVKSTLERNQDEILKSNSNLQIEIKKKIFDLDEKNRELLSSIEETKNIQKKMEQGKQEHLFIIESIDEACFAIDIQGQFKAFNSAVKRLFSCEEKKLKECYLWDFLDQKTAEKLKTEILEFNNSEKKSEIFYFNVLNPDSSLKFIEATISRRLDEYNELTGFYGIARDITERINKEKAIKEAMESAKESDRVKLKFLENINHELRTPLNGINGFTHMLLASENLMENDKKRVELIKLSLDQMLSTVMDLLDFYKSQVDEIIIEKQSFTMDEIIKDLSEQVAIYSFYKKNDFNFHVDEKITAQYNSDKTRLTKIFRNMLEYCVKLSFGQEIKFRAKTTEKGETGDLLSFTIEYKGAPILHNNNFDKDFMKDQEKVLGHFGVGFAVAKYFLEKMGGKIFFFSSNEDPIFNNAVVMELFMEKNKEVIKNKKDEDPETAISGSKILIVEDNIVNQKVAAAMLKKEGAVITLASDGQEGLKQLMDHEIDIILMDIQMPVMDGISATKAIRSGEAGDSNKNIPIIAVTAHAIKADKNKCLDAGMNAYITKPIKPDVLKSEIKKYLNGKKAK